MWGHISLGPGAHNVRTYKEKFYSAGTRRTIFPGSSYTT
jgi:hypothetical protein